MKLLIVDDSMLVRRSIERHLSNGLFNEFFYASDGLQAIKEFRTHLPDAVTLDITMPRMDGIAAMVEMLKVKPETKVMIISALSDEATAIEALSKGAEQFICKPFTAEELAQALKEMFS
jgi:two-component system chemotaxis response regulator CheY